MKYKWEHTITRKIIVTFHLRTEHLWRISTTIPSTNVPRWPVCSGGFRTSSSFSANIFFVTSYGDCCFHTFRKLYWAVNEAPHNSWCTLALYDTTLTWSLTLACDSIFLFFVFILLWRRFAIFSGTWFFFLFFFTPLCSTSFPSFSTLFCLSACHLWVWTAFDNIVSTLWSCASRCSVLLLVCCELFALL